MSIKEKLHGSITKHGAIEMFALIIALVVISAIILYLLITSYGLEFSYTMGDVLMVYIPSILISVVGAGAISYGREKNHKYAFGIGIGMLIVGIAFLVLQTLQILYFGVVI